MPIHKKIDGNVNSGEWLTKPEPYFIQCLRDYDSSLSHIQTQFLVENNDGTITNRTSHLTSSINFLVNSSVSFSSWKVFLIGSTVTNYIKIVILKRHMQCVSIFLYQIFNEFVLIFLFFPFFAVNLISLIHVLHLLMQSL